MRYKNLLYVIISGIFVVLLSSCSTQQQMTISGTPGDQIYLPGSECIGEIPSSGSLKVTISDKNFYPYLISKSPNSNIAIPFALDTKIRNVNGAKFMTGLGVSLASIGTLGFVVGTIVAIADPEPSTGGIIMGASVALGGIGASFGAPASSRLDQEMYKNELKYLSIQRTNSDIMITNPDFTSVSANDGQASPKSLRKKASESTSKSKSKSSVGSSKANESSVDVAKRKIKDAATLVSATYKGDGSLSDKKAVLEDYSDVQVVITRVSKDEVSVKIIESGEDFFGEDAVYSVEKNNKGGYILIHKSIPEVKITIDSKGNLDYKHPKVRIDNEIYTLQISAKK